MIGVYKFPNGNDVEVYKREDIVKCIKNNITDANVILAVINDCEKQCADFISQGTWASIPFIGNFRIPKHTLMEQTEEQKELLKGASEILTNKDYVLFRKQVLIDNAKRAAQQRYFNYEVSKMVTKNRKTYNRLLNRLPKAIVHILFYTLRTPTYVKPDIENITDGYE